MPQSELPPEAEPAFERLRAWRTATAKELGMPPYVIFHDSTLRQIAASPPSTLAGLALINGVGETKLARYGQQILDILAGGNALLPGRRVRGVPALTGPGAGWSGEFPGVPIPGHSAVTGSFWNAAVGGPVPRRPWCGSVGS
jgi:ATP-dependent DNA helicase RecQ